MPGLGPHTDGRRLAGRAAFAALIAAIAALAAARALTGVDSALFALGYVLLAVAAGRLLVYEQTVFVASLVAAAGQVPVILGPASGAFEAAAEGLVLAGVAGAAALLLHGDRERADEARRELQTLPLADAATGLPNRRALERRAAAELARARRHAEAVALLRVELREQAAEDDLRRAARALTETLRAEDIVARAADAELVVLLPGASPEHTLDVALRLGMAIDAAGTQALVAPANFPQDGSTLDDLMIAAGDRLDRAKAERAARTEAA